MALPLPLLLLLLEHLVLWRVRDFVGNVDTVGVGRSNSLPQLLPEVQCKYTISTCWLHFKIPAFNFLCVSQKRGEKRIELPLIASLLGNVWCMCLMKCMQRTKRLEWRRIVLVVSIVLIKAMDAPNSKRKYFGSYSSGFFFFVCF